MSGDVKNVIEDYLKRMEIPYVWVEDDNLFVLPSPIPEKKHRIVVRIGEKWIDTGTLLIKAEDLPADLDKEEFYARLLRETFYANEVTYGLSNEGNVVVHAEANVDALDFKNFGSELGSVVAGVRNFVENIMKDYPKIHRSDPSPRDRGIW